jgi:hypothetical protein
VTNSRGLGGRIKSLIGLPIDDSDPIADAGAARILAGVQQVSAAGSSREWAEAVAKALPAIAGLPVVAVLLRDPRTEAFTLAGMHDPDGALVATHGYAGICERICREAASSRTGIVIDSGVLADGKLKTGLAAPIIARGFSLGAACLFGTRGTTVRHEQVRQSEKFLGIAAPFLAAARSQPAPDDPGDPGDPGSRLDAELRMAGRANAHPHRARINLDGLMLDPLTERSHVGDVAVSLSKTEFKVLYALATTPGYTVSPAAIRNASGAASGLDVTVHRLRRKLARAPEGGNLIQTVRGKGYMLVPPGA